MTVLVGARRAVVVGADHRGRVTVFVKAGRAVAIIGVT